MSRPLLLFGQSIFTINFFTQDYEEEEVEAFDVTLTKNTQGLGITIAGYVGDKNSGEMWQKRRPFRFEGHSDVSLDLHFACNDSGFCSL